MKDLQEEDFYTCVAFPLNMARYLFVWLLSRTLQKI